MKRMAILLAALLAATNLVVRSVPAGAGPGSDTLVSVGSPDAPFTQNKQVEPAVAIDAAHPNVVAAGARDQIDLASCDAGDPTSCPFSKGVGYSGVYFSFDAGTTWTQPTYQGWTARDCLGPEPCVPHVGPIGTLPWYDEAGLKTIGRASLAFGPVPDADGGFSWANGSRLYFANVVENFPGRRTFKGSQAAALSQTDDVASAAAGDATAWSEPAIVTKQARGFEIDEPRVWADNAESSQFFGTVYVCASVWGSDDPGGKEGIALAASMSRDGGATWVRRTLVEATSQAEECTIRTDSHGGAYLIASRSHRSIQRHLMFTSADGGLSWTGPKVLRDVANVCIEWIYTGLGRACVWDGVAGAVQFGTGQVPSISIANGAPTGVGATNVIYRAWVDGFDGLDHEHVLLSYSTDSGGSWSEPEIMEQPGERGYMTAVALSPDGTDAYLVYSAFTTPYRPNTTHPRELVTVVLHSDVGAGGAPASFTEIYRGIEGDPRGSSTNGRIVGFLGEFISADATNGYGVAVWNDVRNAADCPAIDRWRAFVQQTHDTEGPPAPGLECPPTFGNSDIYGTALSDPS